MENFWPFTLRELFWRKEAREKEAWSHTSWIVFNLPTFSRQSRTWAQCNPFNAPETKALTPKEFMERVPEMRKHLPDKLTKEQKDQRWREYCQRNKKK